MFKLLNKNYMNYYGVWGLGFGVWGLGWIPQHARSADDTVGPQRARQVARPPRRAGVCADRAGGPKLRLHITGIDYVEKCKAIRRQLLLACG